MNFVWLRPLDDVNRRANANVDEGADVKQTAAIEHVDWDVGNRGHSG